MPPKIASRPLKEKEQFFINLYVKGGASEEKIAACEKRAYLKPGAGKGILKRKNVQREIRARMEPVLQEQFRLRVLSEAAAIAKTAQQQELQAKVSNLKKIDPALLENELMLGVLGLDWNLFPKEKLDVIKAAYVIHGVIESGNARRLQPLDDGPKAPQASVYRSVFDRLGSESLPKTEPLESPVIAQDIFDLVPIAPPAAIPPPEPSFDEPAPKSKANPNVITVEVG